MTTGMCVCSFPMEMKKHNICNAVLSGCIHCIKEAGYNIVARDFDAKHPLLYIKIDEHGRHECNSDCICQKYKNNDKYYVNMYTLCTLVDKFLESSIDSQLKVDLLLTVKQYTNIDIWGWLYYNTYPLSVDQILSLIQANSLPFPAFWDEYQDKPELIREVYNRLPGKIRRSKNDRISYNYKELRSLVESLTDI